MRKNILILDHFPRILDLRLTSIFDGALMPLAGSNEGEATDGKSHQDQGSKTGKIIQNGYIALLSVLLWGTPALHAETAPPQKSPWFAQIGAGTTGVTGELGYIFNDTFKVRAGISGLSHVRRNLKVGDLKAENLDLRLLFAKFTMDWHFLKNGFRLSAGLALNGCKIKFEKDLNGFKLGAAQFQPGDRAYASYRYRPFAPFIGIGYDSPNLGKTPLSLTVDVGYLMLGKPTASARVDSVLSQFVGTETLNTGAKDYFNKLPSDHKWLKTFPLINIGIKYTF